MGWRGTLRTIEAEMRRSARETERRQKQRAKIQALNDAENTVNAFEEYIEQITSIHTECNSEEIHWEEKISKKPPIEPKHTNDNETKAKNKLDTFKPNLLNKILRNENKRRNALQQNIIKASTKDDEEYQERLDKYRDKYSMWEKEKDIAERLLKNDPQAYIDIIREFNPFTGIEKLGSGLQCNVDDIGNLTINVNIHSEEVIPKEKYSLRQSGTLSTKNMSKGEFNELYQDYVCSCALRVARELYILLPIDRVLVNANDNLLNPETGHLEEQTILSVIFVRKTFETLNLDGIDPSDSMKNFLHNMKFKKTSGFEVVQPQIIKVVEAA
jgi:hypothetical protein